MEIKNMNDLKNKQLPLAPSGCSLPIAGGSPEKPPC
jgi:hypothetical protein